MQMKRKTMLSLVALLTAVALLTTSAYAYFFIYLPSTIKYTAVTPDVQYYRWSDGYKQNNITLTYKFAANVVTYVANATWGIRNSGATPKTVYNWIDRISDTSKISNITIQILTQDGGTVKATLQWKTGDPAPPTAKQSWTADAGANYVLRIWCTGATSIANIEIKLGLKTIEG